MHGWKWPRILLLLAFGLLFLPGTVPAAGRHAVFTTLLQHYVHEGRVDYAALRQDDRLDRYCAELGAVNPDSLGTAAEQMAFWINVYNAFTLKLICDNYPVESINDLHWLGSLYIATVFSKTVWDSYPVVINGKTLSLNTVEHDILRKRFKDYRIHAALVCASTSCPALRREAYEGGRLDEQLDDSMRLFCADTTKNRYDAVEKTLYLSKIFDWFEADFETEDATLLDTILPYFPAEVFAAVRQYGDEFATGFLPYDWSLNE